MRTAEILTRDGRKQTVAYGTIRPMFICKCGYGAFRLFDVYGAFRCASAFGIRYASQQVSRKGSKCLQSQRLCRLLGEYPGLITIHKPLASQELQRLAQSTAPDETNPESRKYNSKRLTERTLKPISMYKVELVSIANA